MYKSRVAIEPHTINDVTRHRHERRRIDRPRDRNAAGRKLRQCSHKRIGESAVVSFIFLVDVKTNITFNEHFDAKSA
jgi:hypothetical protein